MFKNSRLINCICFQQVKKKPEVETTDLIELHAVEENLIKVEGKPDKIEKEKVTPKKLMSQTIMCSEKIKHQYKIPFRGAENNK